MYRKIEFYAFFRLNNEETKILVYFIFKIILQMNYFTRMKMESDRKSGNRNIDIICRIIYDCSQILLTENSKMQ